MYYFYSSDSILVIVYYCTKTYYDSILVTTLYDDYIGFYYKFTITFLCVRLSVTFSDFFIKRLSMYVVIIVIVINNNVFIML